MSSGLAVTVANGYFNGLDAGMRCGVCSSPNRLITILADGHVSSIPLKLDELPSEILCAIFDLAVNEHFRTRLTIPVNPTLLVLQLVSHYWRHLALNTPQLWAYIHFEVSKGATALVILKSFIERSKTVPLDVSYTCVDQRGYLVPHLPEVVECIVTACGLLHQEAYRLRSLSFVGLLHHFFPITNPLPMLRLLNVKAIEPEHSYSPVTTPIPVIPNLVSRAPRLAVFSYFCTSEPPNLPVINPFGEIDLSGLRELGLETCPFIWPEEPNKSTIPSLLALCAEIRMLRICTIHNPVSFHGSFPHLHELDLEGRLWDLPEVISEAPYLVHLRQRDRQLAVNFTGWPAFPRLRTLGCYTRAWEYVVPVLQTSPKLIALRVSGRWGLCAFLSELYTLKLIPNLQLLDIVHDSGRGFRALEEEDSPRNLALIFKLLLTECPKLAIKLREGRRRRKTPCNVDVLDAELISGFQGPNRLEVHMLSWSPQMFAPLYNEPPLSEVFPCHEVISKLEENC